ncbi:jg21102 [Pararge aegeria aegeria]|uniref:Jg21102 protein n=2 Tax=Pararge aegeria TaxID=116150 RepID=A0A8S4RLZ1_9NEOP|nr:jg21102 [Pararge aegeria aegeria]
MDEAAFNISNHCPCKNPQYDQTFIESSVTTNWDLICENRQLASLAQSMLHAGILGGSIFYGHVSDRYGRKTACLLALFCEVLFTALSAAVPKFWMFVVFRFLIGTALGGTMLCCYVFLIELSGTSFRPYITALVEISYISSYLSLPIIAYFVREWRYLQLATSLPWSFVLLYYYLVPESPRWLITTGKKEKAIEVLTYIAKKNKRPIENIRAVVEKVQGEAQSNDREQFGSYLDLFRTPKIRTYALLTAYVWTCCAFTFFGINQYIGKLQGNLFLNVMLSAVSLVPGLFLVVIASLYLKRKVGVLTSFMVASGSLFVFIFIPKNMDTVELVFAIIGQLGAYTAFMQIYLFTSEIFPTIIRNSAMGFVSVFARFGSFTAPFVVNIGIEWVSITIFCVLAFIAASLCYFLPETKDSVLLNTVQQTEKLRSRKINT